MQEMDTSKKKLEDVETMLKEKDEQEILLKTKLREAWEQHLPNANKTIARLLSREKVQESAAKMDQGTIVRLRTENAELKKKLEDIEGLTTPLRNEMTTLMMDDFPNADERQVILGLLGLRAEDFEVRAGQMRHEAANGTLSNIIDDHAGFDYRPVTWSIGEVCVGIMMPHGNNPFSRFIQLDYFDIVDLQLLVRGDGMRDVDIPLVFSYLNDSLIVDMLKKRGLRVMVILSMLTNLYNNTGAIPDLPQATKDAITLQSNGDPVLVGCLKKLIQAVNSRGSIAVPLPFSLTAEFQEHQPKSDEALIPWICSEWLCGRMHGWFMAGVD